MCSWFGWDFTLADLTWTVFQSVVVKQELSLWTVLFPGHLYSLIWSQSVGGDWQNKASTTNGNERRWFGHLTRMSSGWFLVKIYEGRATGWKIVSCSWLGNVWASPGKCWDLGWRRLDGKSGSGRKMNGNTSSIGRNASSFFSYNFPKTWRKRLMGKRGHFTINFYLGLFIC